ncbi:putative toxin-antitoxin system antitoxin component [compost metagenome]
MIFPVSTLKLRLADDQRLTADESGLLFRVAHIVAMAEALFKDDVKVKRWLSKSKERFSGKSPIAMLSTSHGTRRVEEMLIQLADGIAF